MNWTAYQKDDVLSQLNAFNIFVITYSKTRSVAASNTIMPLKYMYIIKNLEFKKDG